MDFFSPTFFGFFLVVLFLYNLVKDKHQKILVFLASSVFIGSLSITFLLYTYAFVFTNYFFAFLLTKYQQNRTIKKIIFNTGMLLNIGSLVFFKYINFLLYSLIQLSKGLDLEITELPFSIILPIGISYYTFQGIGYLLQIYRGNEKLEKDIVVFLNYFLFFPKFLAGPIEQSKHFLPQLKRVYQYNYSDILAGFKLILWGAFKKIVIADRLAMVVNGVYPNLEGMSGNMLIITFLLQPLQLYCDFSGYTDIALGIGRTFGFRLTDNFNRPFFSTSVTEFWRRWHISLTSWCNEFIFMRLSFKNRRWGIWAPVYAVFITFLVIGIWHGPRWNFIILGLLQGLAINYEFLTKRFRLRIGSKLPEKFVLFSSYILVYLFFCFTLVFFNAVKVSDALYFISNMFTNIDYSGLNLIFLTRFDKIAVLFALLFVFIIEFRQEQGRDFFKEIGQWPAWLRKTFYYALCILIIYFGSTFKEFVYMQF